MNISHIEETSLIYGPGIRYVIWIQGCSIHCKGCWNKEMWSFKTKNEISINNLYEKIINDKELIQGITILGGEPFDQYDELLILLKQIRKTDLSIILYTGYTLVQLQEKKQTEILNFIDILITAPYKEELRTLKDGLIGSTNQKILFLTETYKQKDISNINESEISIDENGKINIYGYETNDLQQYI